MTTTKIDRSGTSQSVRLPDGFQFDDEEVEILRRGDEVILRKKRTNLREAFDLLASMSEDYYAEGRQNRWFVYIFHPKGIHALKIAHPKIAKRATTIVATAATICKA